MATPILDKWRNDAACNRYPTDWWEVNGEGVFARENRWAKWVCDNACPVLEQCAAWRDTAPDGIAGMIYAGQAMVPKIKHRYGGPAVPTKRELTPLTPPDVLAGAR